MSFLQSQRGAARVAAWLPCVLLFLCSPICTTAQVLDDFESGNFNVGGTVFDSSIQTSLLPIHCIASTRSVEMHINGTLSGADLNIGWPDDEVTTVWGDNGGRLEFDYDPMATDLTFGNLYNAMRVRLTVAMPAGSVEIVLTDATADQYLVSKPIVGPGDYIFEYSEFIGIDAHDIEFIELNLEAPDFGDYHISDFRASATGTSAAVIDVTQDTVEGPPYPTEALQMTVFYRDPFVDLIPIQILEGLLHEVTNDLEPPATQMMAMDSGGGIGMPGEQVAIAVSNLSADPPGHRRFDLHLHAASVGMTSATLVTPPVIVFPLDPTTGTSFGLGFTTYQHDSNGGVLRRAKHWLSFEAPPGSGLSFSNLSLMLGDPETHPNSFHVVFEMDNGRGAEPAKEGEPLFEMLLGAEILDYPSTTGVSPSAVSGSLSYNVPNPFNPSTEIRFNLASAMPVRLTVHDLAGRKVRVLADGEFMAAGQNGVRWDGRDQSGQQMPSGNYLVKLEAGGVNSMRKIMLLK